LLQLKVLLLQIDGQQIAKTRFLRFSTQ